jgi:hypothetical protein
MSADRGLLDRQRTDLTASVETLTAPARAADPARNCDQSAHRLN